MNHHSKMEKVTSDTILDFLKEAVESKKLIPPSLWLETGLKLNLLLADEHIDLENMRSLVSNKKLNILKGQDKKNVAAAELEIEASDEYRVMRIQEHRVDRIEEFIRLAKKQASNGF